MQEFSFLNRPSIKFQDVIRSFRLFLYVSSDKKFSPYDILYVKTKCGAPTFYYEFMEGL
ncbi:hypothetical protein LEP1GSC175_2129 [Leptospira santarosai str. HAI821]|nr:hypothetical protein LEP1GSC175_2129 [Leptospira santarosai str. HAI821]